MAGTRQASNSTTSAAENWKYFFWGALAVGSFLLILAVCIRVFDVNFPWSQLLAYCGIAALISAIGSTASVEFRSAEIGPKWTAGGAAAIAIVLSLMIGRDPPSRLNMTYYINFPDNIGQPNPADFRATVQVIKPGDMVPNPEVGVPVARAAGGNALKLTLQDVSANDSIILRVFNTSENKIWASAAMPTTESFMNLYPETPQ